VPRSEPTPGTASGGCDQTPAHRASPFSQLTIQARLEGWRLELRLERICGGLWSESRASLHGLLYLIIVLSICQELPVDHPARSDREIVHIGGPFTGEPRLSAAARAKGSVNSKTEIVWPIHRTKSQTDWREL